MGLGELEPRACGRRAAGPSIPPAARSWRRGRRWGVPPSPGGAAAPLQPRPGVLGAVCGGKEQGWGVLAVAHGCPAQHSPSSVSLPLRCPPSVLPAAPAPLLPKRSAGCSSAAKAGLLPSCRAPAGGFGMGQILHLPSCISPHAGVGFTHSRGLFQLRRFHNSAGSESVPTTRQTSAHIQIPVTTSHLPCTRCLFPVELRFWGGLRRVAL